MTSTFLPRQIQIGQNSLTKLGEIANSLGAKNILVIIDGFLVNHYKQQITEITQSQNIGVTFFSNYQGEPTTNHVQKALKQLVKAQSNCVVAIGGGSAIDIAKAVAIFGNNATIKWAEIATATNLNRLPLIAIPTTAGTGSEATKVTVVTNVDTQVKMNPGHPDIIPDVAILDPVLTQSLPNHFTAYTGMDALTHAIEAYLSTRASAMTDNYALTAIKMVGQALPLAYKNGKDLQAREDMLLASCYAGIAFSNASTNLAHAIGRSIGARFNIPHGLSVSLVLPLIMHFGLNETEERLAHIGVALGLDHTTNRRELAKETIQLIEKMNHQYGIWQDGLKYIHFDDLKENLSIVVTDALSGNGITTNRRIPNEKDIETILQSLVEKLDQVEKTLVTP